MIDKILTERELLSIDRFVGLIDFGSMPPAMVNTSFELLATEVAPAIRKKTRLHGQLSRLFSERSTSRSVIKNGRRKQPE
ncbi:hypothetical protein ACIOKD_40200 [Streptomyces sp. NPDC087844]|uniref:hypothetical protein n=1 Tax=Streptomyces sp. NPDC087844 TaxID=3365805 RepID=UPI0038186CF9